MLIRQAILQDVAAITDIYCSTQNCAELSIYERWQQGGAWMSVETCAVWIAHLLRSQEGIPIVAEVNGQVVGAAEVYVWEEPEPYGYHINISSICVHQANQRQGVGTALIQYVIQMAEAINVQRLTVAYPDPIGFFEALGFKPYIPRYMVEFAAQEGRVFYKAKLVEDDAPALINNWFMPMGRFQSARQEWERMRWSLWNCVPELVEAEYKRLFIELTGQPGILHLQESKHDPATVTARLWTKNPMSGHMLSAVRDRAARLGYRNITTLVEDPVLTLLGEVESDAQYLFARNVDQ